MKRAPAVWLLDDDADVRTALTRLLRAERLEVRAFASAGDLLEAEGLEEVECLVLDLRMPGSNGLDVQRLLAARGLDLSIVFLSGHGDVSTSVRAMKAGALDFLEKPVAEAELLAAVGRAVARTAEIRAGRLEHAELERRLATLTARERQVLALVVEGRLNKQIASALGAAEKTIKIHRARVMEKMGADSLADLVRRAGRLGIPGPADLPLRP